MALPVGFNDLWFTPDGDFLLSEAGDLRSTNDVIDTDEAAAIRQFIIHRMLPDEGGWPTAEQYTAALERYIGRPNDEVTAKSMQESIKAALTLDGILTPADVHIRVIPLTQSIMAVMIWVKRVTDKPIMSFAYDIQQGTNYRGNSDSI